MSDSWSEFLSGSGERLARETMSRTDWSEDEVLGRADQMERLLALREERAVLDDRVEHLREKGTWLEFLTGKLLEGEFSEDGSTEEILEHMRGQGHDEAALVEAREALESSDIASKWRWIRKYGGPNGQTLLNEITSSFLLYDGQRRLGRSVRDEERAEVASLDAAVAVRFDDAD